MDITGTDRIEAYHVEKDKEIVIWNHVLVEQKHYINSVNGYESFDPIVYAGQSRSPPRYVTERIAGVLADEFGIAVSTSTMTAIDVTDEEVDVL